MPKSAQQTTDRSPRAADEVLQTLSSIREANRRQSDILWLWGLDALARLGRNNSL